MALISNDMCYDPHKQCDMYYGFHKQCAMYYDPHKQSDMLYLPIPAAMAGISIL
jgi:hypothetical protein